jgi:uncharacterized protein (DUF736 family)
MTEYDNTNRGAIFKNSDKTAENQPDYTGKINVDGVEKRIALWIRESAAGNKYMSASISDPMPAKEQDAPRAEQMQPLADAIPF